MLAGLKICGGHSFFDRFREIQGRGKSLFSIRATTTLEGGKAKDICLFLFRSSPSLCVIILGSLVYDERWCWE
jgi:hypothetical protein